MLAVNATIKQLQSQVLLNTKEEFMKESNTLAGNATIKPLQSQVSLCTKGQHMKESNTIVGNATIKQHPKSNEDVKRHKRAAHEGVKYPCL